MNDTELLDWFETQDGASLVSDDNGRWAVALTGTASIEDIEEPKRFITDGPINWEGVAWVERDQWKDSVRQALESAKEEIDIEEM